MTHLAFTDLGTSASGKTRRWEVRRAEGLGRLGVVDWYVPWRRYVFSPYPGTLYDAACMEEVARFTTDETARHRAVRP